MDGERTLWGDSGHSSMLRWRQCASSFVPHEPGSSLFGQKHATSTFPFKSRVVLRPGVRASCLLFLIAIFEFSKFNFKAERWRRSGAVWLAESSKNSGAASLTSEWPV